MEKTILLVDDDISILNTFEIMLDEYNIIKSTSGEEAIHVVKNYPKIDLIFMDVKMPGINGLEASKKIINIDKSIPIALVTAYDSNNFHIEAEKIGCSFLIFKPFDMNDIDMVITSVFYNKKVA